METGAARWRVLEADAGPGRGSVANEPSSHADAPPERGDGRLGVSTAAVFAAALAIGLAGIAVCLVAVGPTPSATVGSDGSRPAAVVSAIDASIADGGDGRGTGAADAEISDLLVVNVAGAVRKPGVYRLAKGARIADALAAAGGFGARVDAQRVDIELNLAAHVSDGDRIRVPSRDDRTSSSIQAAPAAAAGTAGGAAGGITDLNSASATELDALPGVGPVTASKIIAAREESRFASVDDLVTRKVVGAATVAKLRDKVVVR